MAEYTPKGPDQLKFVLTPSLVVGDINRAKASSETQPVGVKSFPGFVGEYGYNPRLGEYGERDVCLGLRRAFLGDVISSPIVIGVSMSDQEREEIHKKNVRRGILVQLGFDEDPLRQDPTYDFPLQSVLDDGAHLVRLQYTVTSDPQVYYVVRIAQNSHGRNAESERVYAIDDALMVLPDGMIPHGDTPPPPPPLAA